MSDTPETDKMASSECSTLQWLRFTGNLERERNQARQERDELREALQRFVNRLQYNSVFMDGIPRCASVNRSPMKEWDADCIFAFEILEKLKENKSGDV